MADLGVLARTVNDRLNDLSVASHTTQGFPEAPSLALVEAINDLATALLDSPLLSAAERRLTVDNLYSLEDALVTLKPHWKLVRLMFAVALDVTIHQLVLKLVDAEMARLNCEHEEF